ncbi:DUF1284 domain-containing protein [Falsirhodobacter deserti]|uniref:DUF1284 domain-containing protein n=1 Tax=Falsirhodobacter deserti TaxID=1365611 RepID=UPI000FE3F8D2|nr:DUF1284 domain-containing protein [Falsirhodobacter deserti]
MTVRLRPHHLLCVLTFIGKGYSHAFVANMECIAKRLAEGEEVEIVEGPDDICAPLLHDPAPHCRGESVGDRDAQAAADMAKLLGHPVRPGVRLPLDSGRWRPAFAAMTTRAACAGCEWQDLCTSIAEGGFLQAQI